jgi:hypothetical protein
LGGKWYVPLQNNEAPLADFAKTMQKKYLLNQNTNLKANVK